MMPTWTHPTAFSHHSEEEEEAEARVEASGRFTMGPETERFEHELATYHDRKYAIAVNSGSSANLIAATAARLHEYPEEPRHVGPLRMTVVVPALTWATLYSPFWQLGYDFALSDADDTWNAVVPQFPADLAPDNPFSHADWIVACSILGNPAHLQELRQLCNATGRTLIEDNCEAAGARTADGQLTGTFGHLATESFFYSHQASAVELGAILTDDPELDRLCRLLRNHGNAGWGETDFDLLYDFRVFGYNLRPIERHCALAGAQLQKLDALVAARRANADYFRIQTANLLAITHPKLTSKHSSPFGLAFRLETADQRRRLVANLRAQGIDARPPTGGSFTRHPYASPWADQPTPAADLIHDTGLFLGNPPWSAEDLIDRAVKVMRAAL